MLYMHTCCHFSFADGSLSKGSVAAYIPTGYISFSLFNILRDFKGSIGAFEARQEIMQEV